VFLYYLFCARARRELEVRPPGSVGDRMFNVVDVECDRRVFGRGPPGPWRILTFANRLGLPRASPGGAVYPLEAPEAPPRDRGDSIRARFTEGLGGRRILRPKLRSELPPFLGGSAPRDLPPDVP